jgi:hypothetical protein
VAAGKLQPVSHVMWSNTTPCFQQSHIVFRVEDTTPPPNLDPTTFDALASRTSDIPLQLPSAPLPTHLPRQQQPRYAESSVYPLLETNVDALPMSFSREPIEGEASQLSIAKHGPDTPFRKHTVICDYVASLVRRNGYEDYVRYGTTVELAEKVGSQWRLVLRKEGGESGGEDDYWSEDYFDAVIVANGHYNVPYIPRIPGLKEFEQQRPGGVKHTKMFRGPDAYKGKKVVVVGASVSAADIAYDLTAFAKKPVYAVMIGRTFNMYFGDEAFKHPGIVQKPSITHIVTTNGERTVHFLDETSVADVDEIMFGTGYSWTLPFLPSVKPRNNRVPGLYQHIVCIDDPTLLFVGAVGAGLTFKVFEWQAVLAARILAGRATLPSIEEQKDWEKDRVKEKTDGPKFTMINPEFEAYFETLRALAGEEGPGRRLPVFEKRWVEAFSEGHERRKSWWREENDRAWGLI